MANVYDQVQAALEQKLLAYGSLPKLADGTSNAVQFENVRFDPPTESAWWRTTFISVNSERGSFGSAGYSRIEGYMNIDLFYPAGVGSGIARRACDGILAHFKSGTRIVMSSGVEVSIRKALRVQTIQEPDWYHIQARVHWMTHRNEL